MSKKQFELVVFDMAGTTVHDKGNVMAAFLKAFTKYGYEIQKEQVNRVMGYRKTDAIQMLLAKNNFCSKDEIPDRTKAIHNIFESEMINFYETSASLYAMPFAEELFGWLNDHSVQVALNTGFTKKITDVIIHKLHWKDHSNIQFIISSDEVPEGRPHPYMIQQIMSHLGVADPAKVVKVGDTEVDIQEGRNASCGLVISVTTGAYSKDQLQQFGPDQIVDSLSTLRNIIN